MAGTRTPSLSRRSLRRVGKSAEQRATLALLAEGARLVTQSHLSRGVVDLVAVFPAAIRLVQVKHQGTGKRAGGSVYRDRRLLADLARELPECCSCELWTWRESEARWEVELALASPPATQGMESS